MTMFSRFVAAVCWLLLLTFAVFMAAAPFWTIGQIQSMLMSTANQLELLQQQNSTNFIIMQAASGITAILVFGILFWWTVFGGHQRGVKIRTVAGGSAELDINSISQRLEWHLEQVAEVSNVVPIVKARGGAVDIRLEIEVLPEVDIPMKTDEVVVMTRDIIEDTIGLTLGKLDVHLRCAPLETSFTS